MIAAVVQAAGLLDPEVVKQYELVCVIRVKLYAYDERDAAKFAASHANWDDWILDDVVSAALTGKVDLG